MACLRQYWSGRRITDYRKSSAKWLSCLNKQLKICCANTLLGFLTWYTAKHTFLEFEELIYFWGEGGVRRGILLFFFALSKLQHDESENNFSGNNCISNLWWMNTECKQHRRSTAYLVCRQLCHRWLIPSYGKALPSSQLAEPLHMPAP